MIVVAYVSIGKGCGNSSPRSLLAHAIYAKVSPHFNRQATPFAGYPYREVTPLRATSNQVYAIK